MPFGRGNWHSVSFRREGVVLAPGSSRCGGSELRMSSKRGARPLPRTTRVRRRGPAGRRSGLTQLRAPPDQSHCASGHGASNGCCLRLPSWRHPQDPRKYPCVRWGLGPNASGVWGTFSSPTLDRLITSGPETRESALENLGAVAPSWSFWNLSLHGNCLEGLLKHRLLAPTLRVYDLAELRWNSIICLSNKFSGDAKLPVREPHFENRCLSLEEKCQEGEDLK